MLSLRWLGSQKSSESLFVIDNPQRTAASYATHCIFYCVLVYFCSMFAVAVVAAAGRLMLIFLVAGLADDASHATPISG